MGCQNATYTMVKRYEIKSSLNSLKWVSNIHKSVSTAGRQVSLMSSSRAVCYSSCCYSANRSTLNSIDTLAYCAARRRGLRQRLTTTRRIQFYPSAVERPTNAAFQNSVVGGSIPVPYISFHI